MPLPSRDKALARTIRQSTVIAALLPLSVANAQRPIPKADSVRTPQADSVRALQADSVRAPQSSTLKAIAVRDSMARRTDYRVESSGSATRTNARLRDVPQSITVISRAVMADLGMQGMADVVRYLPGISMAQGEGHRDAPVIRGQTSTADFFVDGIRDDAQYYRDIYNVERVEALKGPNAMIFGRGGGGGVINRVTKDALFLPTRTLSLTAGSYAQQRATIDLGQRLTPTLAARFNALYENSATFRRESGVERVGLNPTIALVRGATHLRLGYEFYRDRRVVDRGIPSVGGAPAATSIATFFGDPDASRSRLDAHAVAATLDRQLWSGNSIVSAVQLRNRTRLMTYDKFYQNVFPGDVNRSAEAVTIQGYNNGTSRTNLFNQTDLTATVARGHMRQSILLGTEIASQQTTNARNTAYFGAANSVISAISVPFAQPTVRTAIAFRASATDGDSWTAFSTRAVYAQNQIDITSRVQVLLGIRYDRLTLDYRNRRTDQRLDRTDHLLSPRTGIVIKPATALSVYGSLGVSYLPGSGDQFGSLTATTQTLTPEQFTNREVGIKWDAMTNLALTAATYRLDRTNTTAPDPAVSGVVVQTGAQRTEGWEAGVTGSPHASWSITGGYTNQIARIVSRTTAALPGARVPLVPRHALSLWNRYQLARVFGVGVGVVSQSSMYAAIDNSVTLPSFTRVDGAIFVSPGRAMRAQVNLENALNRRYYPTAHSNNNIMPGSPRMVRVTVSATP